MPDLTIENSWVCETAETYHEQVGKYLVRFSAHRIFTNDEGWSCECLGFKYKKHCKHIEVAKKNRCGWMQQVSGGNVVERDGEYFCPKCGQAAIPVRIAV